MRLIHHPDHLAVIKLPPDAELPAWVNAGAFSSVTRTPDELSIVCTYQAVPKSAQSPDEWIRFEVEGPLPFSLTGVLAALSVPLARAGVSIYPIATHDTDHLLIRTVEAEAAIATLTEAGHEVVAAASRT